MHVRRIAGAGWLVLLGGGEFSFGETLEADRAWLDKSGAGAIGFLPTASGSADYGRHFSTYMDEAFDRRVEVVPVYRGRDARRARNVERIEALPALYLGAGVADDLLETLAGSPACGALESRLESGATLTAIGAAAQACGALTRAIGGGAIEGLGWLPGTAVEANFTPAHDRRLRELLSEPGVTYGLGIPAGSAVLLGPEGGAEIVGTAFGLESTDGDLEILQGQPTIGGR